MQDEIIWDRTSEDCRHLVPNSAPASCCNSAATAVARFRLTHVELCSPHLLAISYLSVTISIKT